MAYVDSVATNTAEYTDEKVRASVSSLGTTFEGRPIKILRLALKVLRYLLTKKTNFKLML